MQRIYLDNNATTLIHPEVAAGMLEDYRCGFANPASAHDPGRRARRALETAREAITELLGGVTLGTHADRLIFTSGGTESNNLAVCGLVGDLPARVVSSPVEHPSVSGPLEYLRRQRVQLSLLPVDRHGVVDADQLPNLLDSTTRLVTVMLGNNETGVLQPVTKIAEYCRRAGVTSHTDAVQAVGKIRVNFRELDVDAMSFSAHKFHGPVGIGGLLLRGQLPITPTLHGGFQQAGLRPGTESVVLANGMWRALKLWAQDADDRQVRVSRLTDRLAKLLRSGYEGLVIHGEGVPRLPHTLSVAFPGIDHQALTMALDRQGEVACSTGSACASGSSEPSPVLLAMGLAPDIISSSIRLSLSSQTTDAEIEEAASRILRIANELRQQISRRGSFRPPRVSATKPV